MKGQAGWRWRVHSVLPGFGPALGLTLTYLSFLVFLPLTALLLRSAQVGVGGFRELLGDPRVQSALWLTFRTALVAALLNALFGFVVAWVLVRYRFPGKRVVDALVDLPFALPTAVSGIALTTVFGANGALGRLLEPLGIKVAYTPLGITVALTLIGLPFVVRTVQPALADLDRELEEAAASLGAARWATFQRVILPTVMPALLTGTAMALARGIGEYGSVVFIAGNMPRYTEIAPMLIITKLEQYDVAGATALAAVMLGASFVLLLLINGLQWWGRRRWMEA